MSPNKIGPNKLAATIAVKPKPMKSMDASTAGQGVVADERGNKNRHVQIFLAANPVLRPQQHRISLFGRTHPRPNHHQTLGSKQIWTIKDHHNLVRRDKCTPQLFRTSLSGLRPARNLIWLVLHCCRSFS